MNNTCCWWDKFIVGFLAVWLDLLTIRRKIEYLQPHPLKVAIQNTLITRVFAIKSFCFIGRTYCSPFPGWSTWTPRSVSPAANTKRRDAVNTNPIFWPEAGISAMWWPLMAAKGYSFNWILAKSIKFATGCLRLLIRCYLGQLRETACISHLWRTEREEEEEVCEKRKCEEKIL